MNFKNPLDILHRLDVCAQLRNIIISSVCEQTHKELSGYLFDLFNMSGPNFVLSVTFIYLMRNRRSTIDKEKERPGV